MRKILVLAIAVLVCLTAALAGCNNSTGFNNGLNTQGDVSSNGGFAVQKGDYVYFVNGISTYTEDNTYGKVATGALVRVKIADLANPAEAVAETVIPALFVAGDKTSGFYIYGNEVFYASPVTEKNKEGEVENSKLNFVKTTLDGSSSVVLKTVDDNTTVYRYVQKGENVYLITKTVNEDGETVIDIHNATQNSNVITTEKIENVIFTEGGDGTEVYYTRIAHNENLDEDEAFNEIHRVTVDGVDEIVFSGAGRMVDDENGFGVSGVTFTLIEDNKDTLFLKTVYVDTSITTVTRYYAVKKSELKGGSENFAANKAALTLINSGSSSASTIFSDASYFVNENCIIYLDATYGLIKYDYQYEGDDSSDNRVRLFYDETILTYTVKAWKDGYLYLADSSNYFYRINVGALVNLETGAVIEGGEAKVEKVTVLATATDWYLPEVFGNYAMVVYTADPYNSLVYVVDLAKNAALEDEEITEIREITEESVTANLNTCISLVSSDKQELIDTYLEDNFGDDESEEA